MHFGTFQINANIPIFVILGGFFVLVFLFGEAKLKRIALAVLAGLFVADQLSNLAMTQLAHVGGQNLDEFTIKAGLLAITTLPLSLGKSPSIGGHFSIRSFVLAILTAVTLIAYLQSFLSIEAQVQLSTDYNLAAIALDNKLWWLTGMVVWLIILHLWKKKAKEDDASTGGKKGKKKKR